MEESLLTHRTNILWNSVLTVIAIVGLTELLLILPWDIPELRGYAFMDIIDIARANFAILDIPTHGVDVISIVLIFFWALAGLTAGARSRRLVQGTISGLLGSIFVILLVTIGGLFLDGLSGANALPASVGLVIGLVTSTIFGGIGGSKDTKGKKLPEYKSSSYKKKWGKTTNTWDLVASTDLMRGFDITVTVFNKKLFLQVDPCSRIIRQESFLDTLHFERKNISMEGIIIKYKGSPFLYLQRCVDSCPQSLSCCFFVAGRSIYLTCHE